MMWFDLCIIFVSAVFHFIRQSILVCAGKSVGLLHVNKHLLASFLLRVKSLFAEAELEFGE